MSRGFDPTSSIYVYEKKGCIRECGERGMARIIFIFQLINRRFKADQGRKLAKVRKEGSYISFQFGQSQVG